MRTTRRTRTIALLAAVMISLVAVGVQAQTVRYVAPQQRGIGSGNTQGNAASFLDTSFWNSVRSELQSGAVTVRFLDGEYVGDGPLILSQIGHADHRLILEGSSSGGTIFNGSHQYQIRLRGVQNATLRNLHFRGNPTDFALHIGMTGSVGSQNVVVENSSFVDLNNTYYGALGMTGRNTRNITIRDNHFERGGIDGHYHHVYTSGASSVYDPGPYDLIFDGNHFQDSRGDYLRLRNQVGYTEVTNNTFLSTRTTDTNRPLLMMPVFNRFDDGGREYLSTDLYVEGNHFEFPSFYPLSFNNGLAISFHASGHNPPGVRYLLTPEEADMLANGTLQEQHSILEDVIGLNLATIRIGENTFVNERMQIGYHAQAAYPEVSHAGWEGIIDITEPIMIPEPGAAGVIVTALVGSLVLRRRRTPHRA